MRPRIPKKRKPIVHRAGRIQGLGVEEGAGFSETVTATLGRKLRRGRIRRRARMATVTRGSVAGLRRTKTHIAKAARIEKTSEGRSMGRQ